MLQGKHILLGVCGGIAVYRVAELARLLIKQGARVRCVMTASACEFVTPLTFEALTGETVHTELFNLTEEREMGHIQLARWADLVVIAPASANVLAKLAHGIADDLLTTMMQVCDAPVLLVPAMNRSMWQSAATQRNCDLLRASGFSVLQPATGVLACGEQGVGRLPELQVIIDALLPLLSAQVLAGERWVINAGPTVEPWDAVRTLSNRASGALGAYLATHAAALGADVCLIAGPRTPLSSDSVARVNVETALEMLAVCEARGQGAHVFVATAAISDFRFATVSKEKMKRQNLTSMMVEMTANPDVVAHVAQMPNRPKRVIAFAAESSHHVAYAKGKLERKGVDAIVANDVGNMGQNMAGGWWVTTDQQMELERRSKQQFAAQIIEKIMTL